MLDWHVLSYIRVRIRVQNAWQHQAMVVIIGREQAASNKYVRDVAAARVVIVEALQHD